MGIEDKDLTETALAKARAERLRYLRDKIFKLPCNQFGKIFGIAPGTIQNWEDARFDGLSEKGAIKIVKGCQNTGIDCKFEWLFDGKSVPPAIYNSSLPVTIDNLTKFSENVPPSQSENLIVKELRIFHELHKDAVDAIVNDDGMAPCLARGDYVAGIRCFDENIEKALGFPCIIQTQSGNIFIRKLELGTQKGHFSLVCTNADASVQPFQMIDVQVFSAAPIIWIRKPLKIF